jgi:hypothetical protein
MKQVLKFSMLLLTSCQVLHGIRDAILFDGARHVIADREENLIRWDWIEAHNELHGLYAGMLSGQYSIMINDPNLVSYRIVSDGVLFQNMDLSHYLFDEPELFFVIMENTGESTGAVQRGHKMYLRQMMSLIG